VENKSQSENDYLLHAVYAALSRSALETSLLGFLHDADGGTVELKHSERTVPSFADSAKVSNATVPAISVRIF